MANATSFFEGISATMQPYLQSAWQATGEFFTNLPSYLRAAFNWTWDKTRTLATKAVPALKNLANTLYQNGTKGLGYLFGFITAGVDLGVSQLNVLTIKGFGLNLASYGAFEPVKYGLSVSLTVGAVFLTSYLAYKGLKAMLPKPKAVADGKKHSHKPGHKHSHKHSHKKTPDPKGIHHKFDSSKKVSSKKVVEEETPTHDHHKKHKTHSKPKIRNHG